MSYCRDCEAYIDGIAEVTEELEATRARLAEAKAEIARADYATRRAVERLAEAEALLREARNATGQTAPAK